MTDSWTIRKAQPTDDEAVAHFLVSVPEFGGTLSACAQREAWRWLYSDDDQQIQLVLIAENGEGAVIAHYGLSKLRYKVLGREVDAGIACLLAIDDRYRNTSIFLHMTINLLKASRSHGWSFITGLANRKGLLNFHKAFKFKEVGNIPVFAKPIRLTTITKTLLSWPVHAVLFPLTWLAEKAWQQLLRYNSRPRINEINVEQISKFDQSLSEVSEKQIAKFHRYFAARGDASIQNTRFFSLACRQYEIYQITQNGQPHGYFALRIMDMKGFKSLGVVDVCFDFSRKDIAREFCNAIVRIALYRRVDLLSILVNSKPLIKILKNEFFFRTPESFNLIVYEPAGKLGLADSSIDDWFITWFEHDFV